VAKKTLERRIVEKIETTVVQDLVSTARGVQMILEGLGVRQKCATMPEITRGMVESLKLATHQVDVCYLRYHAAEPEKGKKRARRPSPSRRKRPGPVLLMPLRSETQSEVRS
jgi:hypothetical protein